MGETAASKAAWATLMELTGFTEDELLWGETISPHRVWVPARRSWMGLYLSTRETADLLAVSDYQVRKRIDAGEILADRGTKGCWSIPTLPLLKSLGIGYLIERPGRGSTRPVSTKRDRGRTSVYLYRDAEGALLYVGITNRGPQRQHEHARSSAWFELASSCELEHYPSRDAAEQREIELIRAHRPPFNKRDNPDWLLRVAS